MFEQEGLIAALNSWCLVEQLFRTFLVSFEAGTKTLRQLNEERNRSTLRCFPVCLCPESLEELLQNDASSETWVHQLTLSSKA